MIDWKKPFYPGYLREAELFLAEGGADGWAAELGALGVEIPADASPREVIAAALTLHVGGRRLLPEEWHRDRSQLGAIAEVNPAILGPTLVYEPTGDYRLSLWVRPGDPVHLTKWIGPRAPGGMKPELMIRFWGESPCSAIYSGRLFSRAYLQATQYVVD